MTITIESGYVNINGYEAFWERRDTPIWSRIKTPGAIELWMGRVYLVMNKPLPRACPALPIEDSLGAH